MSENQNPNGPQGGATEGGVGGEDGAKSPEQLGEGGVKALQAEREARKQSDAKVTALETQVAQLVKASEDANAAAEAAKAAALPEWEQKLNTLQQQVEAATAAQKTAEAEAATTRRIQLGIKAGLPEPMAELLVGLPDDAVAAKIEALKPFIPAGGVHPNPQQGQPSQARGGSLSAGRDRYSATHK